MAKAISQRKLDSIRREWQEKLRLQDWRISSKFVPQSDINEQTNTDDSVGYCRHMDETKTAKIGVLRPEDYKDYHDPRSKDIENTIVHELLHCHMGVFYDDTRAVQVKVEQIIEIVTEALLNEKRRKTSK